MLLFLLSFSFMNKFFPYKKIKNLLFQETTIVIQYIYGRKIYMASCVRDIIGSGK